jgi:hypothetical protein
LSKEQKAIGYRIILFILALTTMIMLAGFAFPSGDDNASITEQDKTSVSKIE